MNFAFRTWGRGVDGEFETAVEIVEMTNRIVEMQISNCNYRR